MGTNYYWRPPSRRCGTCGHDPAAEEELHVGKSSGGWAFSLHIYPERGIHTLEDWDKLWEMPGSELRDEYGRTHTRADMRAGTFHRPEWRPGEALLRHGHVRGLEGVRPDPSGAPVDLFDRDFS